MNYKQQLYPWVIYRHLPNLQRLTVARFRRLARRRGTLADYQKIAAASGVCDRL
jgi:hypothetical protein